MTGARVVTLDGDLDAVTAADAADKVLAAAAGGRRVIVDLAAVEFIDCCAMGALVQVLMAARCAGGDVLLAAPPAGVRRLLLLTGLTDVFSIEAGAGPWPAAQGPAWPGSCQHPVSAAAQGGLPR
jgi:anti-anti-sigma factor